MAATNESPASAQAAEYRIVLQSIKNGTRDCTVPWVEGRCKCQSAFFLENIADGKTEYSTPIPGTKLHLHELMIILAALASIIGILEAIYLMWVHLFHWVKPLEQKQIVRIVLFVPIYSQLAFWGLWFYHSNGYLNPVGQCYGGLALIAPFMLYVQLVAPFSASLSVVGSPAARSTTKAAGSGFGISIMVFQLFITRVLTVLTNEFLFGFTCPTSKTRRYGAMVISILQTTSTASAVSGCIIFEKRLRPELGEYEGRFKLWSFKGIVGLETTQAIWVTSLASASVFYPQPPFHYSWNDITIGILNLILVWEMVVVATMFLWSFDFGRYRALALSDGSSVRATAGRAFLEVVKIGDLYRCAAYAISDRLPPHGEDTLPSGMDRTEIIHEDKNVAHWTGQAEADSV